MKNVFICAIIALSSAIIQSFAQLSTSVGNPPPEITFTSFNGSGFTSSPAIGELDSDDWRIVGMSDGNGTWGGSFTMGDFARGSSSGGVTTGGIYAFDVGSGNISLGIQPTGLDVTPGQLILRLINTGVDPITQLDISYEILEYNDQDRANSLNFAYGEGSNEPATFTYISSLDFTTTEIASSTPDWIATSRSTTISGLNVSLNQFIYLVWETDDVSGSGSRDEIGIDNISFSNILPVELSSFSASILDEGVKLNWRTETEVNNYGFEVQKSLHRSQNSEWNVIGFVHGYGNSNSPKNYSFLDETITIKKCFYRLKQIDTDGSFEFSKIIIVNANNIADRFVLEQNYPNPFNPSTKIKFTLSETQKAQVKVFNLLGNDISTLFDGTAEGGRLYQVEFNGAGLPSGIYFYRLKTEQNVNNRKMLLLK